MDSATTHEQQDAAAKAAGILYGIFHLYGCQEPPQRFAIPLSPYHNPLLSFPQANALPAATNPLSEHQPLSKTRPCHTPWVHNSEMLLWGAPIPCPCHNFCCFHSKCRETSLPCPPASAVEASQPSIFMNSLINLNSYK